MTKASDQAKTDLFSLVESVDLSTKVGKDIYRAPGEKDHVVGTLTPFMQKINVLREELHSGFNVLTLKLDEMELNHCYLHIRGGANSILCDAFRDEVGTVESEVKSIYVKYKKIDCIFWNMLFLEFPEIYGKKAPQVYAQNQVGWAEEKEVPSIDEMFEAIFGKMFEESLVEVNEESKPEENQPRNDDKN